MFCSAVSSIVPPSQGKCPTFDRFWCTRYSKELYARISSRRRWSRSASGLLADRWPPAVPRPTPGTMSNYSSPEPGQQSSNTFGASQALDRYVHRDNDRAWTRWVEHQSPQYREHTQHPRSEFGDTTLGLPGGDRGVAPPMRRRHGAGDDERHVVTYTHGRGVSNLFENDPPTTASLVERNFDGSRKLLRGSSDFSAHVSPRTRQDRDLEESKYTKTRRIREECISPLGSHFKSWMEGQKNGETSPRLGFARTSFQRHIDNVTDQPRTNSPQPIDGRITHSDIWPVKQRSGLSPRPDGQAYEACGYPARPSETAFRAGSSDVSAHMKPRVQKGYEPQLALELYSPRGRSEFSDRYVRQQHNAQSRDAAAAISGGKHFKHETEVTHYRFPDDVTLNRRKILAGVAPMPAENIGRGSTDVHIGFGDREWHQDRLRNPPPRKKRAPLQAETVSTIVKPIPQIRAADANRC